MLTKKDGNWYGTCGKDIWFTLVDYSEDEVFAYSFPVCDCEQAAFAIDVVVDSEHGWPDEYAARTCVACGRENRMLDEEDLVNDTVDRLRCECGGEAFELMGAIHADDAEKDSWCFLLGTRCLGCGLTGCQVHAFFEDDDPVEWLTWM